MAKRSFNWTKAFFIFLVLAALAGAGAWYYFKPKEKQIDYRTAKISKGDVVQSVTANGQLTPVRNVQVGSQISGTIIEINVDFNSPVKQGEVIARIDPATYERALAQSEAELSNATAGLELAKLNHKRAVELHKNKLISESEFNQAEVDLLQAQAIVKIRQAAVERSKVDLDRTTILAPIDGVVISRNIEVGQTVAASFNTPTLFLIANDLSKMQIEAAVSEADVGGVEAGQRVNFTVDAFLNRQFNGTVKQVRYAPTTNQNVVTYTTVVDVNNADLKLRPGMTAGASIIIAERKGVLKIPNAAFRFKPPEGAVVRGLTNALTSTGGSTNQTSNTVALATSGPFAGLPIPPWQAERRRPTDEERRKYEDSLTPEQREQYRQIRDRMRARMAEGGGEGGGFGGGGRMMFAGGGEGPRAQQDGPMTRTVYLLEKEKTPTGGTKQVLRSVTIKTGISDGTNSEVLEGLKEGDEVVTNLAMPEAASSPTMRPPGFGGSPFGGPRR
ncbi:MAG: efflux RND transporter periplasmic adaptor subunit [Verrucomicrobiota bacterium]